MVAVAVNISGEQCVFNTDIFWEILHNCMSYVWEKEKYNWLCLLTKIISSSAVEAKLTSYKYSLFVGVRWFHKEQWLSSTLCETSAWGIRQKHRSFFLLLRHYYLTPVEPRVCERQPQPHSNTHTNTHLKGVARTPKSRTNCIMWTAVGSEWNSSVWRRTHSGKSANTAVMLAKCKEVRKVNNLFAGSPPTRLAAEATSWRGNWRANKGDNGSRLARAATNADL